MTHLLRLISPADTMKLWRDLDERQSAWIERICNVPRSAATRLQALLPRSRIRLGLYAEAEIAPCAYVGGLILSADVRAVKSKHA